MSSFLITNEAPLTKEDLETLQTVSKSEIFRLARKVCANEHRVVTEMLTNATSSDALLIAQGQLRGIKQVYALLLHHTQKPPEVKKEGKTLPNGTFIRNIKTS
jgi:hypothetical protein